MFSRRLLAATVALSALSPVAQADSAIDGAYNCEVSVNINGVITNVSTMAVIVTKTATGEAGFSALAAVPNVGVFRGYALGTVSGNTFSGTNGFGYPMLATFVNGRATFRSDITTAAGSVGQTTYTCTQFW